MERHKWILMTQKENSHLFQEKCLRLFPKLSDVAVQCSVCCSLATTQTKMLALSA